MEEEKEIEIKQINAPLKGLSPLYSNVTSLSHTEDILVLDFGFFAPTYSDNEEGLEDHHIARIIMSWDAVQDFSDSLQEVLSKHKKESNKKKK